MATSEEMAEFFKVGRAYRNKYTNLIYYLQSIDDGDRYLFKYGTKSERLSDITHTTTWTSGNFTGNISKVFEEYEPNIAAKILEETYNLF
jgi:hypothetical protein